MADKVRVGMLNDMADAPTEMGDITFWLEREIAKVKAQGRLDAEIEFVYAFGLGLPAGTEQAVVRAYEELADKGVVLITGPAIGDNALIATPLAEKHRIPTINWAGAERARSEYMFHLQVGSHEDESLIVAQHLRSLGCTKLGVVYDQSPIGTRHLKYLEDECAIIGLEIGNREAISPLAEDASAEVDKVLDCEPDGFIYFGLGLSAPAVAKALTARGWKGPRMMNTAGLRGYDPEFGKVIDGWTYIDMFSDGNSTATSLIEELGWSVDQTLQATKGYDIGRLVAEGLARATEYTPDGLKVGLEQVKWLPAAEGEEGTTLGFGIQDRGALHGRYLVVRKWQGGKSVEVAKG
ncbi:MAG: ABC transporter substrate-binding protein [Novosphingobium sp.]|nr:ABC transporter substrate-binding protein [Novosphingobium sp.]